MVMRLPERDQLSLPREKMYADITVAMGGRVAEELIFGDSKVTSGASSDIEMATKMARNMVTKFGMSSKLGPIQYGENEEEVFLGRSVQKHQNVSEETAKLIDSEIRLIVDTCYEKARSILEDKIDDSPLYIYKFNYVEEFKTKRSLIESYKNINSIINEFIDETC